MSDTSKNKTFIKTVREFLDIEEDLVIAVLKRILDEEQIGASIISNDIRTAWSSTRDVVFSLGGKFFKFSYDHDSWSEDHSLGECYHPDVVEVFPTEKTVIVYE